MVEMYSGISAGLSAYIRRSWSSDELAPIPAFPSEFCDFSSPLCGWTAIRLLENSTAFVVADRVFPFLV